jgi:hypothetical protein
MQMLDISFLNLDQQLLQPCVYLITTFSETLQIEESQTAALNVTVPGDLLTTVEITSNLLGNFRFEDDV